MSEVFSILLHNRQRYEQGKEGLWFSLPTTTEKLQEALREIGISADNPQDFFLYDYRSPQDRPIKLPRDLVLSADVDELNFLAARLEKLDAAELAELNAALTSPQSDFHSIGQIIDYPDNVDYYVHLPDVTGTGQLGDYYLNRSGMVDMPEEWKAGIFLPRFGLHIANTEHGVFTDYGYLVKSGDEWQRVHEGQPVPEEYRVMAYAHLTLGMESKDGMSAADILHVRAGQNYLVEDFTRMERLRSDPVVLESLSRVAQEIGFDRVRPYVVENGSYKAMPDMPFTQWENPYFTVDPPAQEQGDTFTIYQLKGGPETRDYRFEAYESLQEAGLAVDRQNYDLIYTAPLDGKTTLEDIYRTFNLDRPADFTGHSLSVSDVVVLNRSGKEEAHYCDSFGFTPVPEFFLQREKQLTPRELLTGESIQTPRGSFLVTDMSREQLEAAGYGFHHQSEDGKYLIMGNGTDAFAIPAQQESPIKAAEMTTEQNYNMIDGVLNNAPTMSELEAKAKAGEQISLFDVAEAAKAEAQKPKQPQRPAQKQKKPSIRAQLKAAKEEQQKKPPQREKAQELEV